jgi:hypothetical protein
VNALERRKILIENMKNLKTLGIDCQLCPGHCCTFERNSMQVTQIEAEDILTYLKEKKLWSEDLKNKIKQCIKDFRLDQYLPSNGKKSFLRRTYTCPFFEGKNEGCSLPNDIKPYGCLGYNAQEKNEISGLSCRSDQKILEEREKFVVSFGEKKSLPIALMELE